MSDVPAADRIDEVRQRNADRADDVVTALAAHGVEHVFVCPGSRSTPLVFALQRARTTTTVLIDERVAGFAAVGAAHVGVPAAIVTTSGTAVANLLPGACEADADELPWVAVTADRPHSLINTGANQTLHQPPLLAGPCRAVVDLAAPSESSRTRIDDDNDLHAGLLHLQGAARGPVHLNVRFSKPLEPAATHRCTTTTHAGTLDDVDSEHSDDNEDFNRVRGVLFEKQRALVVCGALPAGDRAFAARALSSLRWPVLLDVTSGLRPEDVGDVVLPAAALRHAAVVKALSTTACPDVVLWIGGTLTEEIGQRFIAGLPRSTPVVQLRSGTRTRDPEGRVDVAAVVPARHWPRLMTNRIHRSSLTPLVRALQQCVGAAVDDVLAPAGLTEPTVARTVLSTVRDGEVVLLGNSMPVRDADRYARRAADDVVVITNRGVSGIDGTIATALGACLASKRPTTAFVGDLASLHDLGGIAAVQQAQAPVRIVVVNNGGGGIFSFLPVAGASRDLVERYFDTPHAFSLAKIAAGMGMTTHTISDVSTLSALLSQPPTAPELVEVCTVRAENVVLHQHLDAAIAAACDAVLSTWTPPEMWPL
jgi:2-succinyl-5-enolpyruvyl-6-hydroxy-3-cyclohexene-1-carboxylate synthase